MLLIGDIGGTNARLAYSEDGENINGITVFPTNQTSSLSELIEKFKAEQGVTNFQKACIAVAAPVNQGEAFLTNGSWIAREDSFSEFPLRLVNDLEAAAWGISSVPESERVVLQEGENNPLENQGDLALVIGIGTGLGMALFDQKSRKIYPTEVGHSNFTPFSIDSLTVWETLFVKKGRVRVEDVLSGIGLENLLDIYLGEEIREQEQGKVAGEILLEEKHSGSSEALDFFISALGAFLGDQIISHKASKVFLCGGVAQKIEKLFSWDYFWDNLGNKAPMEDIVDDAQIELLKSPHLGLLGALNILNSER